MKARTQQASARLVGGALIAGALLWAPAAASATPLATTSAPQACEVTGGTLSWGVKESFRSYISGSIANGSWETSEGASYETPEFEWTGASGSYDPQQGTGKVSFSGSVHFTGHDGVLDLTLANPTVEFEGNGKAALLLDTRSTDMEGNVTVDAQQEWVGDVSTGALEAKDGKLTTQPMVAKLTNSGVKAFADFYEAGSALDPITVALDFAACADGATPAAPTSPSETPGDPAQPGEAPAAVAEPQVPWVPIAVGAVALIAIGVTTGMLIAGRKKPEVASEGAPEVPSGE